MDERDYRIGDHVEHDPTGDYLGVVTEVTTALVYFRGPRTRDGLPVTFGGHGEVRLLVDDQRRRDLRALLSIVDGWWADPPEEVREDLDRLFARYPPLEVGGETDG